MKQPASHKRRRAHRRLLDPSDEDPLNGMANLFDTGMVFAVALLIPLASAQRSSQNSSDDPLSSEDGKLELEMLKRNGVPLEHFRIGEKTMGGEGQRLGSAYRLESGEIVYVPDSKGD